MKKILLLSVFSILSLLSFAQIEVSMDDMRSDWQLIKQENGVEVLVTTIDCEKGNLEDPFQYASIKVVNNSDVKMNISFTYELYYSDGCSGCSGANEYSKQIIVEAKSTILGECSAQSPDNIILLVNPLQTALTDLNKLVIKEINIK
jgi:hypothetical protein